MAAWVLPTDEELMIATATLSLVTKEKWDAVIAINLSAAFHAIRAALPLMKTRGWGRIINIASTHGLVASVNKAAYVASKHGIRGIALPVDGGWTAQ